MTRFDVSFEHVNVRAAGALGDGTTDDTAAIAQAIVEAVIGDVDILIPPGTYSVGTLTVPSTIGVRFAGGVLSVQSGKTVTISGPVHGGSTQLWAAGSGTVVVGLQNSPLNPRWWGATGNGSTDDTTALQACIDAALTTRGADIFLPAGFYIVSSSLVVSAQSGLVFRGAGCGLRGNWGTQLIWKGSDATIPLLRVQDCNSCRFVDFLICTNTVATPLHSGVWIENITAGVTVTAQHNIFDNVSIDGKVNSGAALGRGFVTRAETGDTDGNNDFCEFRSCRVTNFGVGGFLFNHSQSKAHILINCGATPNNTTARVLVAAGYDWDFDLGTQIAVTTGGSYHIFGFQGSRGAAASFITSTNGDTNLIMAANVEQVVRFLMTGDAVNAGSSPSPNTTAIACRANFLTTLAPDTAGPPVLGNIVVQNSRGPVTLLNCRFEGNAGYAPQIKQAATSGGFGSSAILSVTDCYFESDSTTLISSQTAVSRARLKGNTWRNKTAVTYGNYADSDYARASGTGTIASGSTAVTITHGLDATPAAANISITPTATTTTDPGNIWVDTIGATTFAVNCRTNPGAGGMVFAWQVVAG